MKRHQTKAAKKGIGTTSESQEPQLLTKQALKDRGWTDAAIRDFLGEPDATKKNPHYAKAAPMCLYAKPRVLAMEDTQKFKNWREGSERRSKSAREAAEKRAKDLAEAVAKIRIRLPDLPLEEVRRQAIDAYNAWNAGSDKCRAYEDSDPEFLARIMVNYLRHNATGYDRLLRLVSGRAGVESAKSEIRWKIFGAIAEKYPDLANEADRQSAAKEEEAMFRHMRR